MKARFIFIISAIITSVIGLSSGSMLAKAFIPNVATENVTILNKAEPEQEILGLDSAVPAAKDENIAEKNVEVKKVVTLKNSCPKPKKEYEDQSYLDVGQDVSLEDTSYTPSDLVELDKIITTSTICLKEEAASALSDMFASAKKDGYIIKVSSGFRSFGTQKAILERNIKEGNKNASIAIAKPGHSEHQLGVAVDLTSPSIANVSAAKKFASTKEAGWLEEHSHEYGFIQSYPEDKQGTTGYMYEAWHYRYVGKDLAKEIIKNSQTINEFLKEKNSLNKK